MLRPIALIILAVGLCPTIAWADYPPNVKQAIDVIVLFCVAGGEEYKISGDAKVEGGLALKKIGVTAGGEITVSKAEARGLVDGLRNEMSKIAGEQAAQARECMKPYINRIINILLSSSDPKSSESADQGKTSVQVIESQFFTFELTHCNRSKSSITCELIITNNDKDRSLELNSYYTKIFDGAGNQYSAKAAQLANQKGSRPEITLVSGVTTKSLVSFFDVPLQVNRIAKLEIPFRFKSSATWHRLPIEFRSVLVTE